MPGVFSMFAESIFVLSSREKNPGLLQKLTDFDGAMTTFAIYTIDFLHPRHLLNPLSVGKQASEKTSDVKAGHGSSAGMVTEKCPSDLKKLQLWSLFPRKHYAIRSILFLV